MTLITKTLVPALFCKVGTPCCKRGDGPFGTLCKEGLFAGPLYGGGRASQDHLPLAKLCDVVRSWLACVCVFRKHLSNGPQNPG